MAPKVVLITGCSTGIGLETAVLLASDKEQSFKVFATMRNLAKKEQLEMAAGATLDKTLFIRELDVTKEDSIVNFIDKIKQEECGVDVLINNAGIGQAGVVEDVTMQQIRSIYETNVFGLIRLTQAVIPGMKAKRSGHIINVSSYAGLFGYPFADIYASSKFAVNGFSESIAPLLRQFSVSVSVIEPGPVKTQFGGNIETNKTGSMNPEAILAGSSTDDLTRKLFQASFSGAMERMVKAMQMGKEIAEIIQEAILSEKPHLHYPTTNALKNATGLKFVDPTGDSVVQALITRNSWGQGK